MGLPFTNSHLVVPHPVLYSTPGLLPLVWPAHRAHAALGAPRPPKGPKLGRKYLPTYKILLPSARHLEEGRGMTISELLRLENCIIAGCAPAPLGVPSPTPK